MFEQCFYNIVPILLIIEAFNRPFSGFEGDVPAVVILSNFFLYFSDRWISRVGNRWHSPISFLLFVITGVWDQGPAGQSFGQRVPSRWSAWNLPIDSWQIFHFSTKKSTKRDNFPNFYGNIGHIFEIFNFLAKTCGNSLTFSGFNKSFKKNSNNSYYF